MDIGSGEILTAVGGIVLSLSGAVGFMFKWMLGRFEKQDSKLAECEQQHVEAKIKLGVLENQQSLAATMSEFTSTITQLLQRKAG